MQEDRETRRFRAVAGALLALHVAKAVLFLLGGRAPLKWDSAEYWGLARSFAALDLEAAAKAIHRPPGYPLFLALHQAAFGRDAQAAAVATQLAAYVAAVWITAACAGRMARSRAAFLAALAAALPWMELPYLALYLLSDTLLCLLAALVLLGAVAWTERPGAGRALLLGLAVGVAALVKPVAQLAWVPLLAGMAWRTAQLRPGGRVVPALARSAGALLLGVAVAAGPWMLVNRSVHGEVFLSKFTGRSLWMSAFQPTAGGLDLPATPAAKRALAPRPPDPRRTWGVFNALVASGLSPLAAEDLMTEVALEAVRAQPARFARSVLRRWGELWTTDQRHGYWKNMELLTEGARAPRGGFEVAAVARLHQDVLDRWRLTGPLQLGAPLLLVLGLAVLARERERRPLALAVLGLAAYLSLAVAATIVPLYRYRVPLDPLVVAAACAGGARLLERRRAA